MDDVDLSFPSNQKRARWRSKCRQRLARHINEQLGLDIQPVDVRLRTTGEQLPYAWKLEDPLLEPLFEKHLSKHSVGAYKQLVQGVGTAFFAVAAANSLLDSQHALLNEDLQEARRQIAFEAQQKQQVEEELLNLRILSEKAHETIQTLAQENQELSLMLLQYQVYANQCWDQVGQTIWQLDIMRAQIPTMPVSDNFLNEMN